jgi:hypothetical protein
VTLYGLYYVESRFALFLADSDPDDETRRAGVGFRVFVARRQSRPIFRTQRRSARQQSSCEVTAAVGPLGRATRESVEQGIAVMIATQRSLLLSLSCSAPTPDTPAIGTA